MIYGYFVNSNNRRVTKTHAFLGKTPLCGADINRSGRKFIITVDRLSHRFCRNCTYSRGF